MESKVLGCFPLNQRHTADYLKTCLRENLDNFEIELSKITVIVSDGEAAIRKACRELVGEDRHLICISHKLAHIIPDALVNLKEVTSVLDKVKSIITLIRRCIPASDKLKELQIKAGKSEGNILKLIQDVPTRWNTTVDMAERYLILSPHLYQAMNECDKPIDILSREELDFLKDIMPLMYPIRDVISGISGSKYPTCSFIIPIIRCMIKTIQNYEPQSSVGKEFKKKIEAGINKRFANFEKIHLLSTSTLLDPRFKKLHFLDPSAVVEGINKIKEKIKKLELEKKKRFQCNYK